MPCGCPLGSEPRFHVLSGDHTATIGRIQSNLNLPAKPSVMLGFVPLLSDVRLHEVTQELGAIAVAVLCDLGEFILQGFIDLKGECRLAQSSRPFVRRNISMTVGG